MSVTSIFQMVILHIYILLFISLNYVFDNIYFTLACSHIAFVLLFIAGTTIGVDCTDTHKQLGDTVLCLCWRETPISFVPIFRKRVPSTY